MSIQYWVKQEPNKPAFPELEWSKPENKRFAGKLLVIGGNLHGFSAPATAFNVAEKAGIGVTRVLLPDAIRKTVGAFMPEADFGPSTPSGSFGSASLDSFLENAAWSDAVLLAGDLGRNSETAILLEKFILKHAGKVAATKDAVDYFTDNSSVLLNRPETLIVVSFAQLQKLATTAKFPTAFTFNMDLIHLVEALHVFSEKFPAYIVVKHHNVLVTAVKGQVSTTKLDPDPDIWRVSVAAKAVVWWIQHPQKPFEAITASALDL